MRETPSRGERKNFYWPTQGRHGVKIFLFSRKNQTKTLQPNGGGGGGETKGEKKKNKCKFSRTRFFFGIVTAGRSHRLVVYLVCVSSVKIVLSFQKIAKTSLFLFSLTLLLVQCEILARSACIISVCQRRRKDT